MSELGDRIRKHLDDAGVSQGQLAQRLGITSGAINKLVQGHSTVSVDRVAEIGQALGLSDDEVAELQAAKIADSGRPPATPVDEVAAEVRGELRALRLVLEEQADLTRRALEALEARP